MPNSFPVFPTDDDQAARETNRALDQWVAEATTPEEVIVRAIEVVRISYRAGTSYGFFARMQLISFSDWLREVGADGLGPYQQWPRIERALQRASSERSSILQASLYDHTNASAAFALR